MTNWHTANRRRARLPRRRGLFLHSIRTARWSGPRYTAFASDMLRQFASATGLTYEQMAEDYDRTEMALIRERYRQWAIYEAEQRAVLAAWVKPWIDRVRAAVLMEYWMAWLIGYNPQRLLPPPRQP